MSVIPAFNSEQLFFWCRQYIEKFQPNKVTPYLNEMSFLFSFIPALCVHFRFFSISPFFPAYWKGAPVTYLLGRLGTVMEGPLVQTAAEVKSLWVWVLLVC